MIHEEQIIDLQTRIAFLEDNLMALNDIVTRQQDKLDAQQKELLLHREKLIEILELQAERAAAGSTAADERPPHY